MSGSIRLLQRRATWWEQAGVLLAPRRPPPPLTAAALLLSSSLVHHPPRRNHRTATVVSTERDAALLSALRMPHGSDHLPSAATSTTTRRGANAPPVRPVRSTCRMRSSASGMAAAMVTALPRAGSLTMTQVGGHQHSSYHVQTVRCCSSAFSLSGYSAAGARIIRSLSTDASIPTTTTTRALVLGSSGALGSAVSRHLSSIGIIVIGADVVDVPPDLALDGFELDGFIQLPRDAGLTELANDLVAGVDQFLRSSSPSSSTSRTSKADRRQLLDAIVCASGGWQMDPVPSGPSTNDDSAELIKHAREYTESVQRMIRMNLDPVVAAVFVAQHCMNPNGIMVVTGAAAALQPTPGMMAYGIAKCASHHVVRTMGASTGRSLESKTVRRAGTRARQALPPAVDSLTCIGILPAMLDTPANRKANPGADTAPWTKPRDIAKEIGTWITRPELRPHSGSLLKVHGAEDGQPLLELVR